MELLQAFQQHPWLNMLHLHVGSQGLQLDTVIAGGRMQRLQFKALHDMRTYVCTRKCISRYMRNQAPFAASCIPLD